MRSENEPTLYKKMKGSSDVLLLCIYVDDIVYMSSLAEMLVEFKRAMLSTFEMSDLGLLRYFLGLEVKQQKGSMFVSQKRYAKELLKKFGMMNCKVISSPMNTNEKLRHEDGSGAANANAIRAWLEAFYTCLTPDLISHML